ncbi:MAG: sulfocyanin-like copper-binding protein [Sulfobacillus sp.]
MKLKRWIVPSIVTASVLISGGSVFAATAARHGQYATNWSSVTGNATSNAGSAGPSVNGGGGYGMMGGYGSGANGGGGYGMMGGYGSGANGSGGYGMMGGYGARGANRSLVNNAQLSQLVQQGEAGAVIDRKTNTVTYKGQNVTLVALASPHGKPNMTWEIDGLVNPTVVVSSKAQVRVTLVNTDWGYMHGFEVTTTPPPYPFMSMMAINTDFLLTPLPQRTTKSLQSAQYDTTAGLLNLRAGTYYYLCPVPGHAQQGMHGTLRIT